MTSIFPELDGWDEIEHSRLTDKNLLSLIKATHKLVVSLANLRSSVSSQVDYLQDKVGRLQGSIDSLHSDLKDDIGKLNKNFEGASASSTKLAEALNKLTFWGVLVAATGVSVALVQFLYQNQIWPFSR